MRPSASTTTSSTQASPSGRCVIRSTARSPAAGCLRRPLGRLGRGAPSARRGRARARRRGARARARFAGAVRPRACPLFADERVETLGKRGHPLPEPRSAKGLLDLRLGRSGSRETDVLANRRREQVRVLARDGDRPSDVFLAILAEVEARERHASVLGIEEAQEEVDDRRLARAARPHQSDLAPGIEPEAHAVESRRLVRRIACGDSVERQRRGVQAERGAARRGPARQARGP